MSKVVPLAILCFEDNFHYCNRLRNKAHADVRMLMHMYIHAFMQMYIHICTQMCAYIHTYMHICIHIYIYTYLDNTYLHSYIHIYRYVYTYQHNKYIPTYIYAYLRSNIFAYIHTYNLSLKTYLSLWMCIPSPGVAFQSKRREEIDKEEGMKWRKVQETHLKSAQILYVESVNTFRTIICCPLSYFSPAS